MLRLLAVRLQASGACCAVLAVLTMLDAFAVFSELVVLACCACCVCVLVGMPDKVEHACFFALRNERTSVSISSIM